ncbi:MAG: hypothetical protein RSD63_09465 [Eubacterium sp.]
MIEITKHAEERFVERVMGYSDAKDISSYIVKNKDVISDRIHKMVDYGEEIYEGKIRDGNFIHVILKDNWVLLLDRRKVKVITLYKISVISDDDDFNKLFVGKMRDKIESIKSRMSKNKQETEGLINTEKETIKDNNTRIKELESVILSFKKENEACSQRIDNAWATVKCDEMQLKHYVEDLVATKIF